MTVRAVLLDLGGVFVDSPLEAIAVYELDNRIPAGAVNRLAQSAGNGGAWARHERGEIDFATFCDRFEAEAAVAGLVIDAAEIMARIATSVRVRPVMAAAVAVLREHGIKVAAVTNNWESLRNADLAHHFDAMVESCREGVRKPDPEIYRRALTRVDVTPEQAAAIDDLGPNLKTAREMGMTTHKYRNHSEAMAFLSQVTGIDLSAQDAPARPPPQEKSG
ncbi:MAG TPA: HAD family phosphatase [Acidimicrobiia bacterium]|nr:HAD family phosphatase [Acidimicrobiia bacterium]